MKHTMLMLTVLASLSSAHAFDADRLLYGAGLGFNSASGASATGFQVFAGYTLNLDLAENLETSVEAGYRTTGNFDYFFADVSLDGVWATFNGSYTINDRFSALARAGLDFGDDDGLMLGGGAEYDLNESFSVRGEYVIRDITNSLQVNFVYRPAGSR